MSELRRYRRLLHEHEDMFRAYKFSKVLTSEEYEEYREFAIVIEYILEDKYGENVMNQIRMGGLWK